MTQNRSSPQAGDASGAPPLAPLALLLCDDLMFAVQLQSMARAAGFRPVSLRSGQELPPGDVLIVNLANKTPWEPAIQQAATRSTPVIAFGPHVQAELRRRAKELGAHRVLANSYLARDLPGVLQELRRSMDGGPDA